MRESRCLKLYNSPNKASYFDILGTGRRVSVETYPAQSFQRVHSPGKDIRLARADLLVKPLSPYWL